MKQKLKKKLTIEQINEIRRWYFEKINTIDKPLAKLLGKNKVLKLPKSEMKEEK